MKRKIIIGVCLFAALSLTGCKHYAHEVYVSSINGSDENLGTKDSPFKTIERANELRNYEDTTSFTYYLEGIFEFQEDAGLSFSNNKVIGYGDDNAVLKYSNQSYAIWLEETQPVILKNLTISNVDGCGISITTAECYMENCVVENCINGAIDVSFDGYLYMKDCTVRNNRRESSGAGIYADNSAMHLDNCLIINNKIITEEVGSNGGGIYMRNASERDKRGYVIENCVISGNEAHNTGGGICADINAFEETKPYTITIKNSKITDNKAYDGGGMVVYEYVTIESEGLSVTDNVATNSGGGICLVDNSILAAKGQVLGDVESSGNTPDQWLTYQR